ncbi:MAG: ATP-dependent sacrificial sulfur transferase LarE [Thermodesulforhabdaceae bacterium]|jgi:uncharacterized protein
MSEVEKERVLAEIIDRFSLPAIAFSGGRDSGFLAWFVKNGLDKDAVILCADHVLMPVAEKEYRRNICRLYGWSCDEVFVDVLGAPEIAGNSSDRCYICKKTLMSALLEKAQARGCDVLFDGTTADDRLQYRPGMKALRELGVYSPLAEAEWTKQDVQEVARRYGLPFAEKPSESCLATRFPYNHNLTPALLRAVDSFEQKIKSIVHSPIRARIHPSDRLIRIEIEMEYIGTLLVPEIREELLKTARNLGFRWVTIDIAGFRSGSWDMVDGSVEEES